MLQKAKRLRQNSQSKNILAVFLNLKRLFLTILQSTKYVECNTLNWDTQLKLFREAAQFSSDGRISYVVANAGVLRPDEVFSYSGE